MEENSSRAGEEHGVFSFIKSYLEKDIYPLHMPGHKRNAEYLPQELLGMEITEFPGADNLLAPKGIILGLERRIASIYGADESFISTNGSTGGILTAVMAVRKQGAHILVARNCHKSVYSALVLSGMKPVYIYPEMTDLNLAGGINPAHVEKALGEYPDICAVIITSPTFEGFLSDVKAIADIAHSRGVPLIVDEAHGANFAFSSQLPASAVKQGADIVVHSLHKRLPMLSQTSVIHVNRGICDPARVKNCFALTQTTSPSYIFLAQIDYCLDKLLEPGSNVFERYMEELYGFRELFSRDAMISLIGKEYKGQNAIYDVDISKLVFYISNMSLSGGRLEKLLSERYGVQLELSGVCHIIAMTSPADTKTGYERLLKGINEINAGACLGLLGEGRELEQITTPPRPVIELTPRDAFYETPVPVALSEAESLVSAGFIIPYPPGIPLVAPGEVITADIISYIRLCKRSGINVIGADETVSICGESRQASELCEEEQLGCDVPQTI